MSSAMQVSRIRAARKSEWLKSALAHHFNPDPCVENEIVVLATGVDQYLQEVFHHLAFYNGDDLVSGEDFRSLCLVLGITGSAETETENDSSENRNICDGLPRLLNFKDFHARLCGFFSEGQTGSRLPVSEETEHIEREIRLRCPRIRRRKCVSFDLSTDLQNRNRTARRSGHVQSQDHLQINSAVESKRNAVDISPQRRWQEQLELENASLRELVEDLRSALQSSDARCMALEVALCRKNTPHKHTPGGTPEKQDCKIKPQLPKHMDWDSRRSTKDLLRELELIRASRDGQLEEAMRFNQRLEEELMAAYGELSRMQETLENVRTENTRIKKRTEEVRGSLAAGLEHVKALQDQAKQADLLRERVQSLENQLEKIRAQCTCMEVNMNRTEMRAELCGFGFHSSISYDDPMIKREEDLQRSVEGRAASDEEEEERGIDEGQCCHLQVKRLINRLHSCAKGCQKAAICTWLVSQSSAHSRETAGCVWIPPPEERSEAGQRKQKEDSLRSAHSLLEDRLTDALTLLLQIPHKRVSRRILGKILISTLDLCTRRSHDCAPVVQVVNTLCQQLLSTQLLDGGEEASAGSRPSLTPGHRNTANPLLMSC